MSLNRFTSVFIRKPVYRRIFILTVCSDYLRPPRTSIKYMQCMSFCIKSDKSQELPCDLHKKLVEKRRNEKKKMELECEKHEEEQQLREYEERCLDGEMKKLCGEMECMDEKEKKVFEKVMDCLTQSIKEACKKLAQKKQSNDKKLGLKCAAMKTRAKIESYCKKKACANTKKSKKKNRKCDSKPIKLPVKSQKLKEKFKEQTCKKKAEKQNEQSKLKDNQSDPVEAICVSLSKNEEQAAESKKHHNQVVARVEKCIRKEWSDICEARETFSKSQKIQLSRSYKFLLANIREHCRKKVLAQICAEIEAKKPKKETVKEENEMDTCAAKIELERDMMTATCEENAFIEREIRIVKKRCTAAALQKLYEREALKKKCAELKRKQEEDLKKKCDKKMNEDKDCGLKKMNANEKKMQAECAEKKKEAECALRRKCIMQKKRDAGKKKQEEEALKQKQNADAAKELAGEKEVCDPPLSKKSFRACLYKTLKKQCFQPGNKVSIVGVGAVGMSCAVALLAKGVTNKLTLFDLKGTLCDAERQDLEQGSIFLNNCNITNGTNIECTKDSRVVVVTAGARPQQNESRHSVVHKTADIIKQIVPELVRQSPKAVFIVVSNPADAMAWVARQSSCLPAERCFSTGCHLDTARFRKFIAQFVGLSPSSVNGFVLGEHGDSSVPLWSSVSVGGIVLQDMLPPIGTAKDPMRWSTLHKKVVEAAYKISANKGYTNWAVGLAVSDVVSAIFENSYRILSLSTNAQGICGIKEEVFLSVPCIVNEWGISGVVNPQLSDWEDQKLKCSAKVLLDLQNSIKL